jgi:glycosyltransferase involved in cell wall biosynthesis
MMCLLNEEKNIRRTATSLLNLDYKLHELVIVDDGSTDKTPQILKELAKDHPEITVLTREKRGFSAVATPYLTETWNTALKYITTREFDFLLVNDGDTILTKDYLTRLIAHFEEDPKLGVICGNDPREPISLNHARNAGRLIRSEIIYKMKKYAPVHGPDTFLLLFSWYLGYSTRHDPKLHYTLQRPSGQANKKYNLSHGRGMKDMGYNWIFALNRGIRNLQKRKVRKAVELWAGYLTARPPTGMKKYQNFMKKYNKQQIVLIMRKIVSKII